MWNDYLNLIGCVVLPAPDPGGACLRAYGYLLRFAAVCFGRDSDYCMGISGLVDQPDRNLRTCRCLCVDYAELLDGINLS